MTKKYLFIKPKFIKSATKLEEWPVMRDPSGCLLPEIAVVGRSNVGKSSLLNHLFQSTRLVKTSSTPGKTQAINFFTLNDQLAFVDLPGYGFAKAPLEVRQKWAPMIETYLSKSALLKIVLFLFDIRRVPNEEDRGLMEWLAAHQKAVILVITKADKVNQSERQRNTKEILNSFNMDHLHHVLYSVPKNLGRRQLMIMLEEALKEEGST